MGTISQMAMKYRIINKFEDVGRVLLNLRSVAIP